MKLLVTAPWVNNYVDRMREEFPQVEFMYHEAKADNIAAAADAEVIFGPVDSELFLAAKNVKFIQSASAGVEWMRNAPELADTEVMVANTRGAHAPTIAEHTMGMLVFLARGFDSLYKSQLEHDWQRPVQKTGVGLVGLTMGIIGLGNIGRAIAKRAQAFDMRVIAIDAHEVPQPDTVTKLGRLDGMPDLIRESDVVVVTVPITPETRGLIGPDELALLKPDAFLLVVSRGGIIHEPTLVSMLKEGKLAGAALDVTETEPLPAESDLWDAPNLFITPHSSPSSKQTHNNVTAIMKDNLRRYLAGETLNNLVDKKLGY
ncbi:MAG: D-2-hydroxyacid dehydrogenase [Chloroflexota bacterium]